MKTYLDNAATTKTDGLVVKAMLPFFSEKYGNASSLHDFGGEAREALEESRAKIAKAINASPEEIIFTSGGTEADNLALQEVAYPNRDKGNHIITSKIEHPAVLKTCEFLEKDGFEITYLNVDSEGFVDLEQLEKSITAKTILVSVMHANNEIGTVQDIEKIGKICSGKGIYFHTDAVQSFTKLPIDVKKMNIDLASFSAHKIHGPKGIGALYVKKGTKIHSLMHGGGQERNLKPGTENIAGAVGFAKAVEIADEKDIKNMEELRDYFIEKVEKEIPDAVLTGSRKKRLCNNINFRFAYVEGEAMLIKLNMKGIACSTGSACSQRNLKPSHVLLALGIRPYEAHGSLRFTISKYTKRAELNYTVQELAKIIKELRAISPLKKGVNYEIRGVSEHKH